MGFKIGHDGNIWEPVPALKDLYEDGELNWVYVQKTELIKKEC